MTNGNVDFFIKEIKEKLRFQYEEAKSYVVKASTLLGFIAIVIGIISSINQPSTELGRIILIIAMVLLFLSLASSIVIAFLPIFSFRRDPDPRYFAEKFFKKNISTTKEWLLRRLIKSYETNVNTFRKVQSVLIISVLLFIIALILIGLCLFIN